ncbi:uroporphyrinogen-III synthase [Staphylococcus muscae]|uniref:Uroporphyrinogen-III synthase n=1 Tax=Staphylococcus muscae TaxID=1294 RepID=A0A240C4G1_9STAP|nr:uroporphyrinogen-III synthase [Staphylococcus muscae]AVQ32962.1 uroporphyrinogen-III synthase [Staphylococcus muscae]PNZ05125.1 uroporphyrinogen-III synthase [Staphylococcus muscae]GGA89414.1 uroporphyrinogen III methyltransferase [Staphylococcus muscae]SNW02203.1 uroporphyrinogen-III synthase [Staphylococcus muscae]
MKPTVIMTQTHPYHDDRINVCHLPLITTVACSFDQRLLDETYDWLIFSSKNAVKYFMKYLPKTRVRKIAVIGEKTKAYCETKGIHVDFVPNDFSQEGFLAQFCASEHDKILLPSSARARPLLADTLHQRYGKVTKIDLYDIEVNDTQVTAAYEMLTSQKVNAITFASSSAVNALFERFPNIAFDHWVVIGAQTQQTLSRYGYFGEMAELQTLEAMIDKILEMGF